MYNIPKDMSPEERATWEAALAPIHPGEILEEEFLKPLGMSRNALSLAIKVSAPRINDIVLGKRGITADTALRLAAYFSVSPEFWLGMQSDYDLATARLKLRSELAGITPRLAHGRERCLRP